MVDANLMEELVGFLHDKNPQVRLVATQELVPYSVRSSTKPHHEIFKHENWKPITDLKLLLLDDPKTAHDALTILINLAHDGAARDVILEATFISLLLSIILNRETGLADLGCMLLSNLAKSEKIKFILSLHRPASLGITESSLVMDQLVDVFVHGSSKKFNQHANYDFLTNLFSDLTRFPEARRYFLDVQEYDGVAPISKLMVFTEVASQVRRTGIASVLKNCCFESARHEELLNEDGLNILLYLQSPLCGPDDGGIKEDEMDEMFEALQFLPEEKKRESDPFTITILLDALLLLCSTRPGRDQLRKRQTYPIIRQLHLIYDENEEISECCDKLVNMLMRDEEDEGVEHARKSDPDADDSDDDDQITEV